jgi:hypothetical protein
MPLAEFQAQSFHALLQHLHVCVRSQESTDRVLVCWQSNEIRVPTLPDLAVPADTFAERLLIELTHITLEIEEYRQLYGDQAQLQWAFVYGYEPRYGEIPRYGNETLDFSLFRARRLAQTGQRVWSEACETAECFRCLFGSVVEMFALQSPEPDSGYEKWLLFEKTHHGRSK